MNKCNFKTEDDGNMLASCARNGGGILQYYTLECGISGITLVFRGEMFFHTLSNLKKDQLLDFIETKDLGSAIEMVARKKGESALQAMWSFTCEELSFTLTHTGEKAISRRTVSLDQASAAELGRLLRIRIEPDQQTPSFGL